MELYIKKIGILLAILLVAGAYAMADESAAAQGELFADVGAVALSQAEMESVDGGQRPGDYASGREWKEAKRERTKAAVKDIAKGGARGAFEAVRLIRGGAVDWVIEKAEKAVDRW